MNGYARVYLIGRAQAAAYNAGTMLSTFPEFAEKSIKLSYAYLLAANGKADEARHYLENEPPDLLAAFESAIEQASIIGNTCLY